MATYTVSFLEVTLPYCDYTCLWKLETSILVERKKSLLSFLISTGAFGETLPHWDVLLYSEQSWQTARVKVESHQVFDSLLLPWRLWHILFYFKATFGTALSIMQQIYNTSSEWLLRAVSEKQCLQYNKERDIDEKCMMMRHVSSEAL